MRIRMKHRAFRGAAKVLPEQQATWEAAGWVAEPDEYETTLDEEIEE